MNFSNQILSWYDKNKRDLPWRLTKDPYKIWLSEIIMQQTQIVQGTSYYLKFFENYPTIFDLANADEQEILVLWQGLGYYSRARNLHHTAKKIVHSNKGKFPETYKDLITLKGIGDYTASAILAICFNQAYPSVDGNIMRVISRLFEITEAINKPVGKNKIIEICKTLIPNEHPGDFNQALMDFGSRLCTPSNPQCNNCIYNDTCLSYKNGTVHKLPNKEKAKPKTKEYFNYFVCMIESSDEIIIRKRREGIWKNLYEFPLILTKQKLSEKETISSFIEINKIKDSISLNSVSTIQKHILSHKELFIRFYNVKLGSNNDFLNTKELNNSVSIKKEELKNFPFPIILRKYIDSSFNV